MKKQNIFGIVVCIALLFLNSAMAFAAFPSSFTNWVSGNVITSAWLNSVESTFGITGDTTSTSLTYNIGNSNAPLGQINRLTTSTSNTGNLIVASSGTWYALPIGANNQILAVSSTASGSIAWSPLGALGILANPFVSASGTNLGLSGGLQLTGAGLQNLSCIGTNAGGLLNSGTCIGASSTNIGLTGYLYVLGNGEFGTSTAGGIFTIATGTNIFTVATSGVSTFGYQLIAPNVSSTGALDITNRLTSAAFSTGNGSSTGAFDVTNRLTAGSASTTNNLTVGGQATMANGSSTGALDVTNRATFGSASTTGGLNVTTFFTAANVSSTGALDTTNRILGGSVSSTGNLTVAGQSVLANTSSSNINASGYLTASGQTTLGNASATRISVPDYVNAGTSTITTLNVTTLTGTNNTLTNTSGTSATISGYIQAGNLTSGNCVQASTGGKLTTTASACGSGSGGGAPNPIILDLSNVSVPDTNAPTFGRATSTGPDGMMYSFGYIDFGGSGVTSSSVNYDFQIASSSAGQLSCNWTQASTTVTTSTNLASFQWWVSTSTKNSSSSYPYTYSTSTFGITNVPYPTSTSGFDVFTLNSGAGITSTVPQTVHLTLEKTSSTGDINLKKCALY